MNPPQVYMCSPSWTPLPPPSPYHLSGSSQCTSPKHPVSCIAPGLATHFIHDILHVSMPFSQIFPPSPSPTESISEAHNLMSHVLQSHPRWMSQNGEFWQNVVHWRRKWQPIPVFLPGEAHGQYEKAKRYDTRKWGLPGWKVSNTLLGKSKGQLLIALEWMKWLGQSRNDVQLWMCLVVKIKSNAVKNNIA